MPITQRSLYKTIEKIAKGDFESEGDLLVAILREFINNDKINIIGGRIWKLERDEKAYVLLYEEGTIQPIGEHLRIKLTDYDVFEEVGKQRTVIAEETHRMLLRKGIVKYSATGIGELVKIGRKNFYEYIMAFNTASVEYDISYLLSIAGQAVTHMLRNKRSEAKRQSLQDELEDAWHLQQRILPQHEFQFGRYDLYGICLPARTVGGDFFNYLKIPGYDDRLGIAVGDAASKGLPAAVQAMIVSGALMMGVELETTMSAMFKRINIINRAIFPPERFLTLAYLELIDGKEGLAIYANAGHCPPIHYHAANGTMQDLAVTGPVIGLLPDATYSISNTNVAKNDVLVLYTDGITEADNGTEEFGEERLREVIAENARLSSKSIAQNILQEVQTFSAKGSYSDDKTIVIIKRIR